MFGGFGVRVIYDISPIGADPSRRAGLARVAENMAERLYERFGNDVRFSATGSLWATLQAEEVLARRTGWRSALNDVGLLPRAVHVAQQTCVEWAKCTSGPARYSAQAGNFALTQVSRLFNVLRRPVDPKALEWADIFHSSYARIPQQVRQQLRGQHLLTVHDLTPLVLGDEYFSSDQIGITRRIIDSVQPDDWVVTVSESTKNDLCERRRIDPERVFVVPNAASDELFYPVTDGNRIRAVRKKYGIPEGRYVLSLHSMAPHKNVPRLIKAFQQFVRQEKPPDTYLVLAGGLGRPLEEISEELSLQPADLDRVHFTGFVKDGDLAPLYSGAEAFVFPSLYEGFGLPVLEAMQCGCPVIASDAASIPEVMDGAGIQVDPRDVTDLARALCDFLGSRATRRAEAEKGSRQAQRFGWDKRTGQMLSVYDKILEER
ncbi:glycosyltransferase involved in cell wall biosynthesis [Salinibacter ruber]|uniref:glycosyltransferase family 4 protein n=1 Tax=Salinibacter ruber TaxID=146919 RepID=UPI0021687269|nr:glycosyltransferase family 1 protein [Salinibacter ruber]MCS3668075.1 glycosyltransferase involved in cell wall biosynthesis [Salinibacter ruber]